MDDRARSVRVLNPTLYLYSFDLEACEKLILVGIISIRLRNRRAQPGWKEMSRWISRSTRTVARALRCLEDGGLIRRIRRGKRLTNLYYVARALWGRLMAGRRLKRVKQDRHAEVPIEPERARELLRRLREGLGKPGGRFT